MYLLRVFYLRVAIIGIVSSAKTSIISPHTPKEKATYPLEVHRMFKEHLTKIYKPKVEGVWSRWSPWTPCSRNCGGGVTQQVRHCVPKSIASSSSRENQRKKRPKRKSSNHCIGLYKRFHLCNTQKCPGGRDFRMEQCAAFNKNPFKGKFFIWQPYLKGGEECALNCRPLGMEFYVTLNRTVIDGTRCVHPVTSTGKTAPSGTLGVCIGGFCKSVASNGVIGAIDDPLEECSACLKGPCKSISGLYTNPDLPVGYSLVAQIPQGACRIFVQQLKHTKNYLALRNANGSYIINGEWKFGPSRALEGAGTRFIYRKQDATAVETIAASGPLSNPIDIMIVFQQPNPGIKYGYSLPMEQATIEQIAPPFIKSPVHLEPRKLETTINSVTQRDEARPTHNKRRIRRRFSWKISGVTGCSKSCGGGMQTTIYSCVREHAQTTVSEKRCSYTHRPLPQQVRCNVQACPAYWGGIWGPCLGSCGQGVQHFILHCQQELSGKLVTVGEALCVRSKPMTSSRPCTLLPSCNSPSDNEIHHNSDSNNMIEVHEWQVGTWSQCSVSCGTGQRTRSVTCPGSHCVAEKRPTHAEYCESGNCAFHGQVSPWMVSEWSHCSVPCGTGTQTRLTICGRGKCEPSLKPEVVRACSSDRYCTAQWFTGPWGSCIDSCTDSPKQTREVLCMIKVRGQTRVTNDMTCSVQEKPVKERLCLGNCIPKWFVGEWGTCEGNCPIGTQRREVRCMDSHNGLSNTCVDAERPIAKRSCGCDKKEDQMNKPAHDEPQDSRCVDKINNCYLAVQARLCQYPYYINNCCVSCQKAPQDYPIQ